MAASRSNPVERGGTIAENTDTVQPTNAGSWIREIASRDRAGALSKLLEQTPIIPAVRSSEFLPHAAQAPGKVVYFLFGNPEDIADMVRTVLDAGKVPIVNLDLVSGFARDQAAISFLARRDVQGIISTHPEPLRAARNLGLFAIKRTFLLDSAAIQNALRSLDQFLPDALEVLPAMAAPHIVTRLREERSELPIIGGGLVHTLREIDDLINQGLTSISVSDCKLWIA